MSEIIKPLILDETGKAIVEALTQREMTKTRIAEINAAADAAKSGIETKTDEQVERITEVTALAEDVTQLRGDLVDISESMYDGRFAIGMEIGYVSSDGISQPSTDVTQSRSKLCCFPFDITVVTSTGFNIQLFEFDDFSLTNPRNRWIANNNKEIISAGTIFKLMVAFHKNLTGDKKAEEIAKPLYERQTYNALTVSLPNRITEIIDEIISSTSKNTNAIEKLGNVVYTGTASNSKNLFAKRTENISAGEEFALKLVDVSNLGNVSGIYIYGVLADGSNDIFYPYNKEAEFGKLYRLTARNDYIQVRFGIEYTDTQVYASCTAIIAYLSQDNASSYAVNAMTVVDESKKLPLYDIRDKNKNIVLLGDSIVWGVGSSDFWAQDESTGLIPESAKVGYEDGMYRNSGKKSWAAQFISYMNTKYPGSIITNNGIGGDKWTDLATKISSLVPSKCTDAIICMGINDKDNINAIHDAVISVITYLKQKNITPYVLLPIGSTTYSTHPKTAEMICSAIKIACADCNIVPLNLFAEYNYCLWTKGLALADTLKDDGLHPNDTGHEIIFINTLKLLGI